MVKYVIKRDGSQQDFNFEKISNAIGKAYSEFEKEVPSKLLTRLQKWFKGLEEDSIAIEQIQDTVQNFIMDFDKDVATAYITYRYQRKLARENTTDSTLIDYLSGTSEYWMKENANKKADRTSCQRDKVAGITSTDFARRILLPSDVVKAHDAGIIHLHDIDYMIHPGETNCCLINLKDMLANGTILNDVKIETPHKFSTACTITTQIQLQVSSAQYGGQTISCAHLAPYLVKTREKFEAMGFKDDVLDKLVHMDLVEGVQTYNYQINSFSGSNGQAPFATFHIDLEEEPEYENETMAIATEFLNQRIQGFKNADGVWITPTFPKIIVVLRDKYFTDPKYHDFIYKCAECTAKRMVPDYMSEKNMLKYKGAIVPAMGCRSLLKPLWTEDGKLDLWGRFNLGVCTINLPYAAYIAQRDSKDYFEVLDEYLALCHKAQLVRVKRIANTTTDCAPILWQDGVFTRMPAGTKLAEIIYGGRASISLGYAGVYEATKIMTGESHSTEKGFAFAEKVMKHLDETTKRWAEEDNLGWSVYGTPIESTTYKFAKALQQFGYDKDYVTNSIHIPVTEDIDPFEKLRIEGLLQPYSTGGNVNYVEASDLTGNLDAVIEIMKGINEYSLYAEINSKHDYCYVCGSEAEQGIDENMNWFCPVCGNSDQKKLFHARRVCGYIATGEYNKGRTADIKNRFVHVDNHDAIC